jgi:TP901 family phage tail tape measure protein
MAIDLDVHGNTKPLEAAVQAAINRIRRQPIKITVDDKGATQPLGNMKRAADEFSKSMEAANARILAFGASMAIINGVADAFKGMVRNLVQVEKSLADINVVMGLSNQNLEQFGDGLFKVAKETGAAFRVAADAATEYARQGLAVEETLKRTRDALVLTRLTGMDSAEAVKSLTAAMNTYGNQIKDTTQLVSKFAAVDVQFAVSAEDFAAAISRTGQAAKSAGVDIDELIGIVTSAQQQTARGGAVIGNALKTIFTKTGRTDTLNQLENLGIAVRDLEGNTIGAKRILTDLANTFDILSEAQKAQITQTMGGLFHINILKAVLSDAAKQNGILANATQISANATDEAIQKNEQLRKTMDAMASETGNAIKQLSVQIGELMLAPGMEKILNTVKSLAEGASDILGDGESAGNQFANGFLKGLGNVITGPGLVIITTVFVKLFMTAAKFTKESLSSLIGVTSEAQKQKAIQTSLVALIGQNAALGKEMLRTDISRTEKEKIILGLLKAQVVEANALNRLTAGMAGTLYRKGYGANLTPVGKKASGHIPNFANPERAQAAQGGYAAGNIRSMNMPGEGPVIYNSAETVKNFAGFKQPAIMPPQSSKAGKNYQQAFGSIHGFDPYAAGGYIPNFNKSKSKAKAGPDINLNSLFGSQMKSMGVLLGFGSEGLNKGQEYSQTYNSLPPNAKKVLKGKNIVDRGTSQVVAKLPTKAVYKITSSDTNKIKGVLGESKLEKQLYDNIGAGFDDFSRAIGKEMFKGKIGQPGTNVLKKHMDGSVLGGLFEYAVRGSLDNEKVKDTQAPFDFEGSNAKKISEFMSPDSEDSLKLSLVETKYNLAAAKSGGIPKKILNYIHKTTPVLSHTSDLLSRKKGQVLYWGQPVDKENKGQQESIRKTFPGTDFGEKPITGRVLGNKFNIRASGFIPNFADPLSDAIGREKAAGVPVSQIRVGSHSALMSKGNPLGLGVTNTYDEPNGLRDVFGANGFVPNYASQGFDREDFVGSTKSQRKKLVSILNEKIKAGKLSIKSEKEFAQLVSEINPDIKLHGRGIKKANQLIKNNNASISSNNSIQKTLIKKLKGQAKSLSSGIGAIGGYMSGAGSFIKNVPSQLANKIRSPGSYMGSASDFIKGPYENIKQKIGNNNPIQNIGGYMSGAGSFIKNVPSQLANKIRSPGSYMGSAGDFIKNPYETTKKKIAASPFGQNWQNATTEQVKKIERLTRRIQIREKMMIEHERALVGLTKEDKQYAILKRKINETQKNLDKSTKKLIAVQNSSARGIGGKMGRFSGWLGKSFGGGAGMAMMMGAPMAAGFLQQGGMGVQGGSQAMYATGGALTGAASGAMMASMIAPMFGPGAPLVIALGGAVGAYKGWASATEENTKALKERSNEISKQNAEILTQTFGPKISQSIFGGEDSSRKISQFKAFEALPEYKNIKEITTVGSGVGTVLDYTVGALAQGVNDIINFVNPFASILDKSNPNNLQVGSFAEGMRGFEVGSDINIAEASNMARQTMIDSVMPILQKDIINAFKDMGDETLTVSKIIQDKETGKSKFGDKKTVTTASGYLKELTESGILEDADQIKTLAENLVELYELNNKAKDDEKKGMIIQLNLQRAMITAQKASADAQLEIKSKFLDQVNLLDSQEKLLGGFIREEQKVRIQYNKSLLKASEAYKTGAEEATKAYKTGLIQDITSKPAMQQELKKELFGGEAGDKTMVDVTSKLAKMNAKELEAILLKIGKTQKEANEIVSNRNLLYDNAIDTLKKQQQLTNKRSKLERDLNMKLAERKTLMEDINRKMDSYVSKLDYASKLRGISSDLQAARFGAGPARTQEEIFAEQQRLVRERQHNIQSEYIRGGLSTVKAFGDKIQLTEKQRMQVISNPNLLKSMSEDFMNQEQASFYKTHGQRKKELESITPELLSKIGKGGELTDSEINQLEEHSRILDLENNLKKAKTESLKESKKITEELERQIGLKDAQISKEEELQRIREKEYARKTGPGAFGEGIKDARIEMAKQVEMMDYELGKRIPTAFADGLAGAMTEALNGTKSIKEALSDAALSFLQMIQQAMMQKAAYSMVGAMGFSRGGNVRNYSRGGGVPAMVSNGEYVMGRDAVAKYGGSFMHSLNAGGRIPGFSNGGQAGKQQIPVGGKYAEPILKKSIQVKQNQQEKLRNAVEEHLISKGTIRRESDYSGPGAAGSALAANFGGGRGFKSGRQYQRRAMSGFFYAQSGNVGLGEDTSAMGSILQEEERIKQEAERKRQEKKAKRRQLIGSLVGIAAGAAISHFSNIASASGTGKLSSAAQDAGFTNQDLGAFGKDVVVGKDLKSGITQLYSSPEAVPKGWVSTPARSSGFKLSDLNPFRERPKTMWQMSQGSMSLSDRFSGGPQHLAHFFNQPIDGRFFGGPIRKYASGGYISGKSGIDQIPAMLSEGEYVIRASSARQIGKPMLDRINAGKFNDGGIVGGKLYDAEQKSSGNASNSINISINIDKSGSASESSSGDKSKETGDLAEEKNQTAQMANKIKQQVLSVISEEKRPGGLLY